MCSLTCASKHMQACTCVPMRMRSLSKRARLNLSYTAQTQRLRLKYDLLHGGTVSLCNPRATVGLKGGWVFFPKQSVGLEKQKDKAARTGPQLPCTLTACLLPPGHRMWSPWWSATRSSYTAWSTRPLFQSQCRCVCGVGAG